MKTLKRNSITFLLLIFFINSNAQVLTPKWETCLGGTEWDEATGIIEVDTNYWIIANTNSNDGDVTYNHGTYDCWLLHVNNKGSLLSEKTFGGSYADGGFLDILKLNDSIFYIAGNTKSNDGDISNNPWAGVLDSYWVLQTNNQGDILWDRVCGGSDIDDIRDAVVTVDGGIIILGISVSTDGDVVDHHGFGNYNIWLIKLDVNGTKQWTLSLGGEGDALAGSIIQTSDGGYMVVGATDGWGGGNYDSTCNHHGGGNGFSDVWLVKLDSSGSIEWQQCYGGTYSDLGSNALEINDGYIILAFTQSNDGDVSGYHGAPGPYSHNADIWVFKIDKSGNLLWQKCLGGSYWDAARNIFPTTDGGYMIVGTTRSDDGDVVGYHAPQGLPGYADDVWFAKIDSVGNLVWQYCYGGELDEFLYRGVIQKSDWDYVLAIGTTTNEWQCYYSGYPDVRVAELYDSTVGVKEVKPLKEEMIRVFPNPAGSVLNIDFPANMETRNTFVEIIDINGRTLLKSKSLSVLSQLDISKINSGIYLVKIQNDKTFITKKIIKQ